MNRLLDPLKVAFIIVWAVFCFWFGRNVPIAQQESLYDALRNMSAIIFGIMGAWTAILHPDLLSHLTNPSKLLRQDMPDSRHLITPMVYAACALAFVLIMEVLRPIASQFDYLVDHSKTVRGMSFSILGALTVLQIWALILSFVPYGKAKMEQERELARRKKADVLAGNKNSNKTIDSDEE